MPEQAQAEPTHNGAGTKNDSPPSEIERARAAIDADARERATKAKDEIDAALLRHRCTLYPRVTTAIGPDGQLLIGATVDVVPR